MANMLYQNFPNLKRRVWWYQRGNQNIVHRRRTDNTLAKRQKNRQHNDQKKKDKQRSTKHTYKAKDRVTRNPLWTGCELRCSRNVGCSSSTSGTRRVNPVTNLVISYEWGKDQEVFTTSETYPWSFVTQIFHSGQLTFRKRRIWVSSLCRIQLP